MVLYNSNNILTRYHSVLDIIEEYYKIRLIFYDKRRENMLSKLNHNRDIYENKIRFIQEQMDNTLILYKKKKDIVLDELETKQYKKFGEPPSYEYLLGMRMDSVTMEKLEKLKEELNDINDNINDLDGKSGKDLWINDIDDFMKAYIDYYKKLEGKNKKEDLSNIKISSRRRILKCFLILKFVLDLIFSKPEFQHVKT